MENREFNILLLGAGGVGTIAALTLEKSGRARVTAVLRSGYEKVSKEGWRIDSVDHGQLEGWRCWRVVQNIQEAIFPSPQPTNVPTGAPTPHEPSRCIYDFILICTKSIPSLTTTLISQLQPLITPSHTSIVLIQNGLFIERPFITAFPNNVIMSAVSMIGSFVVNTNEIRHLGHDVLEIGPHFHPGVSDPNSISKTQQFVDLYSSGGAKQCTYVQDMPKARYTKLLWNASYNCLCALTLTHVGSIQSSPAKQNLVIPIMNEIVAIARADGVVLDEGVVEYMSERSPRSSRWRPSMLLDREKGREMEVEVILGNAVERGRELGVETKVLGTVCELLRLVGWGMENKHEGEISVG